MWILAPQASLRELVSIAFFVGFPLGFEPQRLKVTASSVFECGEP